MIRTKGNGLLNNIILNQAYLDRHFKVSFFLSNRMKCYTIRERNRTKIDINLYQEIVTNPKKEMQGRDRELELIQLYLVNNPNIKLMIIPPGYPSLASNQLFTLQDSFLNRFSYDVSEYKLLPYPYKTDCYDYSKSSITQPGCRHDCVKQRVLEKFGIYHPLSMVNEYDLFGNLTYYDPLGFKVKNIYLICKRKCIRKDCHLITFTQRKIDGSNLREKGIMIEKVIITEIVASNNNVIKTETLPSIPVFAFITNVLSTFGIYCGISLFSFQILFDTAVGFVSKKYKINIGINKKRLKRQVKTQIPSKRTRTRVLNDNNWKLLFTDQSTNLTSNVEVMQEPRTSRRII